MNRFIFSIFILLFLTNCNKQVIYSGKILNQESFDNINYVNKNNLLNKLGRPSYIDPVSGKYFYFSEKAEKRSIFNKTTNYSYIFVFEFDKVNNIVSSKVFDLGNNQSVEMIADETSNEIVKRGLLEKVFGGVGPQKEIATTP